MKRIETSLPGVWLIEPLLLRDERGSFCESFNQARYAEIGINNVFVQDNYVTSIQGVVRGLHFQNPRPQAKLCYVTRGRVLDVVVDVRTGSPHFGRHLSIILSEENHLQIYVPEGFAHGYAVLSEAAEFVYKCSDYYFPAYERGLMWNDPELGIDWQVAAPILSAKDRLHLPLARLGREVLPAYAPETR